MTNANEQLFNDTELDESFFISEMMMQMLGAEHMAYIKPVFEEGEKGFAVYASDGAKLAVFETHEAAFYNALQHNLDPVSIH